MRERATASDSWGEPIDPRPTVDRPAGTVRTMSVYKKLFFLCCLLALSLVLVEVFLIFCRLPFTKPLIGVGSRTVEYGPFLPDRSRFWRLTPSHESTEVNSKGFRGPDFSENKPGDVYRIFCLGNSCCFGTKVPQKVTYPAQLEKLLNANPGAKKVEVINAGVPGYSSLQELRYLREEIVKYDPDMVIVQYGENDEEGTNEQQEVPSAIVFGARTVLSRSRLYQAIYSCHYGRKRQKYDSSREYRDDLIHRSYVDCLENLAEMEACAEQNRFRVYFIVPTWFENGKLVRVERFAKEPQIDIFESLAAGGMTPDPLYLDEHHWTAAGHLRVAKGIYGTIYRSVLLDTQSVGSGDTGG